MNTRNKALWIGMLALPAIMWLSQAGAQTLTWDATTGNAQLDNGAGTWVQGGGTQLWTTDNGVTNQDFVAGNAAEFGSGGVGIAGKVSLGGNVTANQLTFQNTVSGYEIDLLGNTLTTNNTFGTIQALSGANATISDSSGTGAWNLNTTSWAVVHTGGGTLTVDAKITGTGRMYTGGGGSATLTNNTNDFTGILGMQNGGNLTVTSIKNSGVASAAGAGSVVQAGFNAAIRYTGSGDSTNRTFELFGANNGTLRNDGSGALTWTGAFSNATTAGGNRNFILRGSNTDDNHFQGIIADHASNGSTASVIKNDAGKWILSGNNTYTGTTTIADGTLEAGHANSLGNGGNIIFTGGELQYGTGITADYSTRIVNSTSAITIDTNGNDVTYGTAISNSNTGGLTKEGTGTLDLKLGTSYSGTTTINDGTLRFTNGADLTAISSTAFNINNGSTLEFQSSVGGPNRTVLNGKTITFDGGSGTLNFNNGNHLFQSGTHNFETTASGSGSQITSTNGGFINNQGSGNTVFTVADGTADRDLVLSAEWRNGQITKSGAGTMAITGTHFNSLPITINAGTLEVGESATLDAGTFTATIANDGVFEYSSTADQTLSGVMSGTGALVKEGDATLSLFGTNTYDGTTTVSAGTLLINGDNSGAMGAVTVGNGATIGGTGTVGGLTAIQSGGILSPGNSPGIMTYASGLTLETGSHFTWELANDVSTYLDFNNAYPTPDGSGVRGTDFDGVNVTGGILAIQTGAIIDIVLNGTGSMVDFTDPFWDTGIFASRAWLLFDNANAPTFDSANIFDTINVTNDPNGVPFTDFDMTSFTVRERGGDVYLVYSAVPEPGTAGMLGLILGSLLLRRRRRRLTEVTA